MKKRTKIIITAAALVLIAALAVFAIINRKATGAGETGKNPSQEETVRFTVETEASVRGSITDYIKINGDVVPAKTIEIYPDTAGKLRKLHVSIGDFIKINQVIAEIDPSRPGLSYTLSPVRSTISGTVTSIPNESGATVSLSTPVATIGDLSMLQVKTEIAEPYISKIRMGTSAQLNFVAHPGSTFSAHIVEISPVVNLVTRTMGIKLEFDKVYPEIKAGMFASVKLFTESKENAVLVRSEAVVIREGGNFVFTAEEGKAVMNRVEKGLTVDGITEIISGINAGSDIVVRGQNLLDDGVEINVIGNNRSL